MSVNLEKYRIDELRKQIAELDATQQSDKVLVLRQELQDLENVQPAPKEVWEVVIYGFVPMEHHDQYVILELRFYIPTEIPPGTTKDEKEQIENNKAMEFINFIKNTISPNDRFVQLEEGVNRVSVGTRKIKQLPKGEILLNRDQWENAIIDAFEATEVKTYNRKRKTVRRRAQVREEHEKEYKELTGG